MDYERHRKPVLLASFAVLAAGLLAFFLRYGSTGRIPPVTGPIFLPIWTALFVNALRLTRPGFTVAMYWRKIRSWLVIAGFFLLLLAFGSAFGGARGGARVAGCGLLAAVIAAGFVFHRRYRRFLWWTVLFSLALWIPLVRWLAGQPADFVTSMIFMIYCGLPAYAVLLGVYEVYARARRTRLAADGEPPASAG